MAPTQFPTLSSLLEKKVQPDPEAGLESAADACLMQSRPDEALSGYYQLEPSIPRIATKMAYCEWVAGRYEEARTRLFELEDDLEEDGIGLLSQLIVVDSDWRRRRADMEAIWPRLQAVIAADSIPLVAAVARSQGFWPNDGDDREQRRCDVERLLEHHPANQYIRLAVLLERQIEGADAAEQYALLKAWPNRSPAPRYLWQAAKVAAGAGQPAEAIEYLNQLEARERKSFDPSSNLLFQIELARCAVALEANAPDSMSGFDRLLGDASLDGENRVAAILAALEAACRVAPERVSELGGRYLEAREARGYGLSFATYDLSNDSMPVEGTGWDMSANTWPCGDVRPHLALLSIATSKRAGIFFRACHADSKIDEQIDSGVEAVNLPTAFWDGLAEILGDVTGFEEAFEGRILSLRTAIRAHRAEPNWAEIGRDWVASEWAARQVEYTTTHGDLTVDLACREAETVQSLARGVIAWLKDNPVPAPSGYDMVENVVDELRSKEVRNEYYQLMEVVSQGDDRPGVQFDLGLSAQWMKKDATARKAYLRTLANQPDNGAAIFNALLLCKTPTDAQFLEEIAGYVAKYAANDSKLKTEIDGALVDARKRCEDVLEGKRRLIRKELSRYPALSDSHFEPADISLRSAVALLALFRCANAEPGDDELPPFEGSAIPFAPVVSCQRVLFDLLGTGLVTVHPKTSTDAFAFKDGELIAWRFGSIRWRLSPSCELIVDRLRSMNGTIPDAWREEVQPLAFEIARGEVVEYLNFLADERGWPTPRDTEEVADLTRALVNELPVAQAFHMAYLGAMSASDYKQKYPVSAQQASDMLVKRAGQRLESVRAGRFPAREYERPWKVHRSALSLALWGTILDRGDDGFTRLIADLAGEF
ncbi:MAG TPA: hypothetical protein VJU59_09060 [Paraburkholderia sp.]|uniref:tetratricopeptide repeat protein n=1 Tax=Paraburkholderia sp. TaxID=1926495 RepID=UPI002B47A2D6|nr:hypothetical protein [Paraburkholderia sp.]HKR39815.1 hypothetical protein [Paraburkholderia sp.]